MKLSFHAITTLFVSFLLGIIFICYYFILAPRLQTTENLKQLALEARAHRVMTAAGSTLSQVAYFARQPEEAGKGEIADQYLVSIHKRCTDIKDFRANNVQVLPPVYHDMLNQAIVVCADIGRHAENGEMTNAYLRTVSNHFYMLSVNSYHALDGETLKQTEDRLTRERENAKLAVASMRKWHTQE